MVAADESDDDVFIGLVDEGFNHFFGFGFKEFADRFDGADMGGVNFFGAGGVVADGVQIRSQRRRVDFRFFDVGGVGVVFGGDEELCTVVHEVV